MQNLTMPYPCFIPSSIHISRTICAEFTQISMQNVMGNLRGIHAQSLQNLFGIYLSLIHAWFHAARGTYADFTQISRGFHADVPTDCDAESFRSPCGIHLQSTDAFSMLDSIQHADSRKFYADFTQTFMQIATRKLCWFLEKSLQNPCEIYLCFIDAWFHAESRFYASFTQISRRLLWRLRCRIFAKPLRNLSRIHAESICYLVMPYPCLILCSMQIYQNFHGDFTLTSMQNAMRNPCRIYAESIYALSMLDSWQHADFTQTSTQNGMLNLCRIFAES